MYEMCKRIEFEQAKGYKAETRDTVPVLPHSLVELSVAKVHSVQLASRPSLCY